MEQTQGEWESFGSVGLSGSMFFQTVDRRLLLKSIGRTFENRFLHQHFLPQYFDHVKKHPDTLINKLFDVMYSFDHRFGGWIKCVIISTFTVVVPERLRRASPSHYIVIENISAGKTDEWEIYDLKPTGYLEARSADKINTLPSP